MEIGSRIHDLRVHAGMTQKDLADRLFVTAQAVSRWEQDLVEPNLYTLNKMASIFNVSVDFLLGRETNEAVTAAPGPTKEEIGEVVEEHLAAQKRTIGVCSVCHRPILEGEKMHVEKYGNARTGRHENVYCDECYKKEVAETDKNIIKNNIKWRGVAWGLFALGLAVGLAVTIVLSVMMSDFVGTICAIGIPFSIMFAMFLYCLGARNTEFSSIYMEVITWGCVKLPGIIFSWSIEGIVWMILMKILFWILGILITIGAFAFATVICTVLSIFFFPIAVKRSYKNPEKTESKWSFQKSMEEEAK